VLPVLQLSSSSTTLLLALVLPLVVVEISRATFGALDPHLERFSFEHVGTTCCMGAPESAGAFLSCFVLVGFSPFASTVSVDSGGSWGDD